MSSPISPPCEMCGESTVLCSYCGHHASQHAGDKFECKVAYCDCGLVDPVETGEMVAVDRDRVTGALDMRRMCGDCRATFYLEQDERERREVA